MRLRRLRQCWNVDNALVDLLGKPIAESSALCIPTGVQPFPGGPSQVYRFISGSAPGPMCELGWKSLGVLELAALPSIKEEHWIPEVEETDALLVYVDGNSHSLADYDLVMVCPNERGSDPSQGGPGA